MGYSPPPSTKQMSSTQVECYLLNSVDITLKTYKDLYDYYAIYEFLTNIAAHPNLLRLLEQRFNNFLITYQLKNQAICLKHYLSDTWLCTQKGTLPGECRGGLPRGLPLPADEAEMSDAEKNHLEETLTLFLYQQLIELNILDKRIPIDQQIFYCCGFIEPKIIEAEMKQNKLFIEEGGFNLLNHGSYTHLLHFVFIGLAIAQGILKLNRAPWKLIRYLVETMDLDDSSRNSWRFTLDTISSEKILAGPHGLNVLMLSKFAKRYCPHFFQYYSGNYRIHLEKEMIQKGMGAIETINHAVLQFKVKRDKTNDYIKSLQSNPNYNITQPYPNNSLFYKHRLSPRFQHIAHMIKQLLLENQAQQERSWFQQTLPFSHMPELSNAF